MCMSTDTLTKIGIQVTPEIKRSLESKYNL